MNNLNNDLHCAIISDTHQSAVYSRMLIKCACVVRGVSELTACCADGAEVNGRGEEGGAQQYNII